MTSPSSPLPPPLHEEPAGPDVSGRGGGARSGGALPDVVAVLGTYVALGVVAGLLWWALYDPAEFTVVRRGGVTMGEVDLGKRFNADAWYAVIAGGLGLVSGTVVSWWRSRDPLLTTVLVLLGSGVAAGVMSVLGGWLGPADPQQLVASAEVGARLAVPLSVDATVCYLVWPVTALIGCLVVLWSPPTPPG